VLLCPEDVDSGVATEKMERSSLLTGGTGVAVFFLLKNSFDVSDARGKRDEGVSTKGVTGGGGKVQKDPMEVFLELQIVYVAISRYVPSFPLSATYQPTSCALYSPARYRTMSFHPRA
jgi:hypothetical protein